MLILLTGASGYIAQHILVQLLEEGYDVVGTVRSSAKGEALQRLIKNERFQFEVVPDIGVAGAFDHCFRRHKFQVVLHTASPFTFNVAKQDIEAKLLRPAIDGTNNLLISVLQHAPSVEHVVITSSYSAMMNGNNDTDPTAVCDEQSWNGISWQVALKHPILGYLGSKTFAEKAAWEFISMQKPHFSINTVNPVFVFGPQAFSSGVASEMNTSVEIINKILKLKSGDKIYKDLGPFVDVRDVARAHLRAFQRKDAYYKRLFLTNGRFTTQSVLNIVNRRFPELNLPAGNPSNDSAEFSRLDDSATRKVLGLKYVSLEDSVYDTVSQIVGKN